MKIKGKYMAFKSRNSGRYYKGFKLVSNWTGSGYRKRERARASTLVKFLTHCVRRAHHAKAWFGSHTHTHTASSVALAKEGSHFFHLSGSWKATGVSMA